MRKILLGLLSISALLWPQEISGSKQLLVVSTQSWSASTGKLQRYEWIKNVWIKTGKNIDVKLGRNGLGWGVGLHTTPKNAKFIKKEGDGKAPAGIFSLRQVFGYQPFVIEYPYEVYTVSDHCVDDVKSKFYNKIVNSKKIKVDYKSFEHMKLSKNYYKYGIVIDHNHIDGKGAVKGAGSCIFMHIKSIATSGCTVMRENEIKEVIKWLDADSKPLLVQGTEEIVDMLIKEVNRVYIPHKK